MKKRNPRWSIPLLLALAPLFAGSLPAASLQITNLQAAPEGWILSWPPLPSGSAYTIQFQDSLQDRIWRLAPSAFPVVSNRWTENRTTNNSRFYRVVGVPAADRGKLLLPPAYIRTVSLTELAYYYSQGIIPVPPKYPVRLYKVLYETITPLGARTQASGALALPENTGQLLPLVSFQHGTLTQTNSAPSAMNLDENFLIAAAFATSGYALAEPDFLGLGDSPGLHPYHHARSEATAGVDLLRAVRIFCATNGFSLTNRLFLCGYSQGGHATLALQRELETYHTNEFTVTASAPMAGAYDLSGVMVADFLSGRSQPNPYYFLYLLAAYQDVYNLAPSLADLLAPPYNITLPPLLNGATPSGTINAAMPAVPVQILKPEYLAAFAADPRHPLRLALLDNDLWRWKPSAQLRLYHCDGDQDVPVANSQVAAAAFQAAGANAVWIDTLINGTHASCSIPSLAAAKAWFDTLR